MKYEWIGWLATTFLGLTFINRILGGTWLSSADVSILNQQGITRDVTFGFFSIPVPGAGYLSGLWNMLSGNYSFFGGNAQIFFFLFQTVTFMIGFSFVVLLISVAVNAIRGR